MYFSAADSGEILRNVLNKSDPGVRPHVDGKLLGVLHIHYYSRTAITETIHRLPVAYSGQRPASHVHLYLSIAVTNSSVHTL